MKYFITLLFFVTNMHYSNAQTVNDSIIAKGSNFTILKSDKIGLLNYNQKLMSLVDRDTIFYNNYKINLPLIEVKWWMQSDEVLTLLYKSDQIISIDAGWKEELKQGKITNWKLKKYKRRKKHIAEDKPIDLNDVGLIQIFKDDWELLFTDNVYIQLLDKKIDVKEVYHYTNGVVNILVINKGELNNFIKKNINSFSFR